MGLRVDFGTNLKGFVEPKDISDMGGISSAGDKVVVQVDMRMSPNHFHY